MPSSAGSRSGVEAKAAKAAEAVPRPGARSGGAAAGTVAALGVLLILRRKRGAEEGGDGVSPGLFRRAIDGLVPYEPGKPVEEVQRELGLERVVKLASNEGPFPPFPAALEAIARARAS